LSGEERKLVHENLEGKGAPVIRDEKSHLSSIGSLYIHASYENVPDRSLQTHGNAADYEIPIKSKGLSGEP